MKKIAGALIISLGFLPVVSIILWTFISRWPLAEGLPVFNLNAWKLPVSGDFTALTQAAAYAAAVSLVSCVMAAAASRALMDLKNGTASFFEGLFFFPALLPVLCVVLGTHQFSLKIAGGALGVPMFLLYVFFSFPYAFRIIYPPCCAGIRLFRETSFTLGASPGSTFFLVELPLLSSYLGTAFTFAYAVAYGQYLIEAFFLADTSKVFSVRMAETLTGANRSASAVYTLYYVFFGMIVLVLPPVLARIMKIFFRRKRVFKFLGDMF